MSELTGSDTDDANIQESLLINNSNNTDDDIANTGSILNLGDMEDEEENFLSDINTAVPYYKTCAKILFYFSRWPLIVYIVDNIFFYTVQKVEYKYYRVNPHRDAWIEWNLDLFVVAGLIINVIFLFLAVKVIDKDIAELNTEQQNDQKNDVEEGSQADNFMDWNNYQYIYGRLARKIDIWLLSTYDQTHNEFNNPGQQFPIIIRNTSFLSHLCRIAWAFCFANSYSHTLDLAKNRFFPEVVNITVPSSIDLNEYKDISGYENVSGIPEDVLQWIYSEPGYRYWSSLSTPYKWNFPVREIWEERQPLAMMNDRLLIRSSGPTKDKRSVLLEIVAINNTIIQRYHNKTEYPYPDLFIPIESSINKDNPSYASEYCFLSGEKVNIVYCTNGTTNIGNSKKLNMKNATLKWEYYHKEWERLYGIASYQNLVYIMKDCDDDGSRDLCQEVIKLDPTTMKTSKVYSMRGKFDTIYGHRKKGRVFRFSNFICGLGLASYHLISKGGAMIYTGIFSLTSAFALLMHCVLPSSVLIILGMISFHYLIYTGGCSLGRRNSNLRPVWIDRNLYIWALYGWNFTFAFRPLLVTPYTDYYSVKNYDTALGPLPFFLTGLILNHPALHMYGYALIIFASVSFFHEPSDSIFDLLIGFLCIMLGNWFSKHKFVIYMQLRYIFRCLLRDCMEKVRGRSWSRYTAADYRYE